ncbi:helix-turn-helix domain-containing protein [Selenomonas ruminantium]|uniref:Helix-turn-helix n=1 Tax=Selenomonas ruminantium TaxID=971 RepID=A0A1I0VJ90_SELRU|nr:helix-turn-helix transcriptional regulator [Selenomonas ruminantium]SFA76464.1 Helix-turn-helix [Selenomonas ruminantium]
MATVTGDRLRALRQDLGLSQEEVAKKIGVSRPAYVNYEQGKSRPVRKLQELAALFNVSTDYILGEDVEKPTFDPPAAFFNDPNVGKAVEKARNNPKFQTLLCVTSNLKEDELDSLLTLAEHYAKKHNMT